MQKTWKNGTESLSHHSPTENALYCCFGDYDSDCVSRFFVGADIFTVARKIKKIMMLSNKSKNQIKNRGIFFLTLHVVSLIFVF